MGYKGTIHQYGEGSYKILIIDQIVDSVNHKSIIIISFTITNLSNL